MIDRKKITDIASGYDKKDLRVGVLASHSALDVADGAIEEGLKTVLYCQRGREKTYARYFKSRREGGKVIRGIADECKVYEKFKEVATKKEQKTMVEDNVLFVPNRSFTSYVDIKAIEDEFMVPLVGSRNMLATEERGGKHDYYWLLEKAGLPFPEKIKKPENIDELCIVKLHHAQKKLSAGFSLQQVMRSM